MEPHQARNSTSRVITAAIQWNDWHKLNGASESALCSEEQSLAANLDSTVNRVNTFWQHLHGAMVQQHAAENDRAAAAVQRMRELRDKQHAIEAEQKRTETERTIARLLREKGTTATVVATAANNTSSSSTAADAGVEDSGDSSSGFGKSRADELREAEMVVASRRSRLADLRAASKAAAELSSSSINDTAGDKNVIGNDSSEKQKRNDTAAMASAVVLSEEKRQSLEAEEKLSVALYEVKRQARMRLEEDRLRRAADRVSAEAAGKQCEQEHRLRRMVEKVEKQRRLYESKRLAAAALAEEGSRLRQIRDRDALIALKAELLKHVADIDDFLGVNSEIF